MEFLNIDATTVFVKLIDSLSNRQRHRKIENEPYMPLTIERIGTGIQTPWGTANLYSLCHYYKQNGDLMQDPEMSFIATDEREGCTPDFDKVKIAPYMFQQADLSKYEESVLMENYSLTKFNRKLQHDHTVFANHWLLNIQEQGFLKHLP